MWFARKEKNQGTDNSVEHSCESLLASIASNGVELSLTELMRYQNKCALINLVARKNVQGKQSGNYLSRSKGRGMEFDEVRHYQTGDDIRAIDWRVTARTGTTHTKLFREEIERPVLIATDLSTSMHFGSQLLFKSVQAAHLASLVAWHAKSRGDRLGGLVFNNDKHVELKPRSRKAGVLHYLHALTLLAKPNNTEQHPEDFDSHCARLRHLAKPGSLVYLITDGQAFINYDDNQQHALRHLAQISQHCELVVCLINDSLEFTLPASTRKLTVTLTDGIDKQQLTLGHKNTEISYQQQASLMHTQKRQRLQETGARIIEFSAGQTLEQQLKNAGALL
ncbi:DUF58 domain-containing protein [Colwellia sp. D2M02]|uniref:DUF58 domain-containing protein n=1 Tax=Colwellia sp. D2M02 TaxID=2841562 RepID=UPI001C08C71C|nr:DUF58 domain-containing protein [Colwellia sp. D2M02]MBU2892065.1 DUF58 domain-containing protein [Colwellia sp. D2M02]